MLDMAQDPSCDFYYSPEHVIEYCSFIEKLQHVETGGWELNQVREDGTVDPHIILEPWQIWIEAGIHGFRRKMPNNQQVRLVTTALTVVPRKSAKSLATAGAALFDLCCSGQRGPQVTIAAATEKQAERVFGPIVKFINNDPDLVEQFKLRPTRDTIKCDVTDGVVLKLSSIGERQDGLNPSLAIMEEAHAGSDGVYNVVRSSFGARQNALLRMITTAGYHPSGPAWQLIEQAKSILDGRSETYSFFAAIYTLDREDYIDEQSNAIDWNRLLTDETLVRKCNPMYGVGLLPHMLEEERREAHRDLHRRGEFARTRFNIWTSAGTAVIDASAWGACKKDNLELSDFYGKRCWIGVDMASKQDMCAIGLVFEVDADNIAVFAEFFLPEASKLATDPGLGDTMYAWADLPQSNFHITEGAGADHRRILQAIQAYCEYFDVQIIACDPYQAHATSQELWGDGRPVMSYPNNALTMTGTTDDLLTRVAQKTIWHDGNPLLAWNATNVHVERKANGSIIPRKGADDKLKIDGFVAIAMANGSRMQPEFAKPSGPEAAPVAPVPRVVGYEEIIGL